MFRLGINARTRRTVRHKGRNSIRMRQFHLDVLEERQLMASSLVASSAPIAAGLVEGAAFTAVVAKFTDSDDNTNPALYSATIDWGDGQTTQGTVVKDPTSGFDVVGSHTYAMTGAFRATAQIADTDNDTASVSTTNVVQEAPIRATALAIHGRKNVDLRNITVATFTDADPSLSASAFSATINWGDGHTTVGRVLADPAVKGFKVVGTHEYRTKKTFAVTTKIAQGNGAVSSFFTPSNIISDGAVAADHVDPNFVNPWGLAAPKITDFWDSNNGTGTSTVFDNAGNISAALFAVNVPPPAGRPALRPRRES